MKALFLGKTKRAWTAHALCVPLALLAAGCQTRTFGDTKAPPQADLRTTEGSTNTQAQGERCGVPSAADYATQQNNRDAADFFETEASQPRWNFLAKAPWKLASPAARAQWLGKAVSPLSLGCKSYRTHGPLRYGEPAMQIYLNTVAAVLGGEWDADIRTDTKKPLLSMDAFLPRASHPDVAMLRAINAALEPQGKGTLRGRGEQRIHGEPLTDAELAIVKEMETRGLVSVHEDHTPFENSSGDMVSGHFLMYPDGSKVQKLMTTWQSEASAPSVKEGGVSKLVLDCILIHPFGDGNGRTCTLWGAWKMSTLGSPHAVLWSGADNYLSYEEWAKLSDQGVAFHVSLLGELRK